LRFRTSASERIATQHPVRHGQAPLSRPLSERAASPASRATALTCSMNYPPISTHSSRCARCLRGSSRWRVYWHAISHSASHRVGPAWVRRCCAETRAFTPIRCWRPTCANSRSGATGRHVLIAVARYLAAHSPTERAVFAVARMRRDELSRARPPVSPRHPRETPSHLPPAHHSPRVAPPIGV
jgi:hypothetical protein